MNIEDIKIGQLVLLHMDRARFSDLDWAFLMRESEQGKKNGPTPEGRIFWVEGFVTADRRDAPMGTDTYKLVTLCEIEGAAIYKAYLAEDYELTLIKDVE